MDENLQRYVRGLRQSGKRWEDVTDILTEGMSYDELSEIAHKVVGKIIDEHPKLATYLETNDDKNYRRDQMSPGFAKDLASGGQ